MRPALISFDIFGTVLDWRAGLRRDLAPLLRTLTDAQFDALIDLQGRLEQQPFQPYADIVAQSLVTVLGLPGGDARAIGAGAGTWPLYPDSQGALVRLQRLAPCAALTNSDVAHGAQVRAQLGFPLTHWLCAEDTGTYKPDPRFFAALAQLTGIAPGPHWWHVSAYADYDHVTAKSLGLTTVLVERPHFRFAPADRVVPDLAALADALEKQARDGAT